MSGEVVCGHASAVHVHRHSKHNVSWIFLIYLCGFLRLDIVPFLRYIFLWESQKKFFFYWPGQRGGRAGPLRKKKLYKSFLYFVPDLKKYILH